MHKISKMKYSIAEANIIPMCHFFNRVCENLKIRVAYLEFPVLLRNSLYIQRLHEL